MKISELTAMLNEIEKMHGDIEVAIQDAPPPGKPVTAHESFFVVDEEYDDGWRCNLRWWPC